MNGVYNNDHQLNKFKKIQRVKNEKDIIKQNEYLKEELKSEISYVRRKLLLYLLKEYN